MSGKINIITELKSDNELFNVLVNETTDIMKAEILQSVMNRHDEKRSPIVSRHEMLTKDVKSHKMLNKDIKPMDKDKRTRIRFDQANYKIKSKYEKLVKNNIDMEEVTSVGDVVANNFSRKSPETKKEIIKNIQNLDKIDPQISKKIKLNNYIMSDAPPIIKQVKIEENFSQLVQETNLKKLLGSTLKVHEGGILEITPLSDELVSGIKLERFFLSGIKGYDKYGKPLFHPTPEEIEKEIKRKEEEEKDRIEAEKKAAAEQKAKEKALKSVELNLHGVRCVDETGGNWFTERGQDEIDLGGVTLDNNQNQSKIREFRVGNFDSGDEETYNPPKILKTLSASGSTYPKIFSGYISLAEKDAGGFSSFLSDLYEAIRDELDVIIMRLGAAAGAALLGSAGGVVGSLAGPLGTLIGVAAGFILGALVGWIVSSLKDDIFPPQMCMLAVDLDNPGPGTSEDSEQKVLQFNEHDAVYKATVSWTARY